MPDQDVVFVDAPLSPRPWAGNSSLDTESEIKILNHVPSRERIAVEITRPKRFLRLPCHFSDRDADVGGVQEFRSHKDPHFTTIRESDIGIQAAPTYDDAYAQTTWYRALNKAVQYEAALVKDEPAEGDLKDAFCSFLENATIKIELALQQNETVDIFHETFRMTGDDELLEGPQAENELRETKNFADPTYSKLKVLVAIDWMPKATGMVAVSAIRNLTFDQRMALSGQTNTSYVLLWDFRQLVRPQILMQSPYEVLSFRFNPSNPNIVVGGCVTGQTVLWDLTDALAAVARKANRGSSTNNATNTAPVGMNGDNDEDDISIAPVPPKHISSVDYSHKRGVSDILWLAPNTQFNHRGQLVSPEHLDNFSHQFLTVAGDGQVMVWDTRFEAIANDELRHIGRVKHVPQEKAAGKEGNGAGNFRPLWTPIFKAHLKRLEGVGELSLVKVCPHAATKGVQATNMVPSGAKNYNAGDPRSQYLITTEEGDVLLCDLSTRKSESTSQKEDEEDDVSDSREFVRWISKDHSRPSVSFQHSPFFSDIYLSVGDTRFNLWKVTRGLWTSIRVLASLLFLYSVIHV